MVEDFLLSKELGLPIKRSITNGLAIFEQLDVNSQRHRTECNM